MAPLPHQISTACDWCGRWLSGPFKGQVDVPIEELHAHFERVLGHPPAERGTYGPAPFRPGGLSYHHGGGEPAEPMSGGLCVDCHERISAGNRERIARLRRAMAAPEPEPPLEATGTAGPEPSEEEARSFLMAAPDDGSTDDDEGGQGA